MSSTDTEKKPTKTLYPYQTKAILKIMDMLTTVEPNHNILYQLPTGGGKTVIFSEITKRWLKKENHLKKVLILTHRIELSQQTANVLEDLGIKSKVISSDVKHLDDQAEFQCFVAMVETLNNRLDEDTNYIKDVGLVIVDEAHYNSFRKLFHHFDNTNIIGVTATPLSSNKRLPLNENYNHLVVGESIADLIKLSYLAKAETYSYSVSLRGLKVGITGDFTVSSSERVYSNFEMQDRLLAAYEEKAMGKKTLIFNAGIMTSIRVAELFKRANYPVRHLDSTFSQNDRRDTLDWFRNTPDAILSSVGILTTGFDEPSVQVIILNRATRSLTLYHQMIGRGSRILPKKKDFTVIDLGNNALRLGYWEDFIDWNSVFLFPDRYLEKIKDEESILYDEEYEMPPNLSKHFTKTKMENSDFSIREAYDFVMANGQKPQDAIDLSIDNHALVIEDNADDFWDALELIEYLQEEIEHRLKQYATCITKSTDNYIKWLIEEYSRKLRHKLRQSLPQ